MLAVIDGAAPAMVDRAITAGEAPALALLAARGRYEREAVAAFPSVTPVCSAAITTGVGPDRHQIPSMNWFHRDEGRYVEYGSSFRASLRFGLARQLTDTIYNMNGAHLAADATTVFEHLDDHDVRTLGTTYLIYRGRHRHEPAQASVLARLAARSLVRRPVMGPRELFYADVFESQDSGCRSTLGLPGVRDQHAGCVGAYAVTNDLFDFMLLSLPDNDGHSHREGVGGQVASIAHADRQLVRLFDAAGGAEEFLSDHAVIVIADHAHTDVEQTISLGARFADFDIRRPTDPRPLASGQIALCPAQRSAMIYTWDGGVKERVLARARTVEGVEHVLWREGDEAVAYREGQLLRFAPGEEVADLRGRHWALSGEPGVFDLTLSGAVARSDGFPDALGRVWDVLDCPTAGDVVLSAAAGYEFLDWGGAAHVGGGSHGSLAAADSHAPLITTGLQGNVEREQWSIADVPALVYAHFGV